MVKYTVKGDYFDCQLYDGNLFLWTYEGALKIYDFNKLMAALDASKDGVISEIDLLRYLIGQTSNNETRFPTDSEVYGGNYYVASRSGLYQSRINYLESGFRKVWDCPLMSVAAQRKKGVTLAGGSEGVFIYPETEAVQNKYGMKDNAIIKVAKQHANYSTFCSQGLYATSLVDKSFFLNIPCYRFGGRVIPIDEIFPGNPVSLSWSYRNRVYAYLNEKIYVKIIEREKNKVVFRYADEYWFYPQKGRVISGSSTQFADIIELEHALVIFPTFRGEDTHAETIWEPVTRWRVFPKSLVYDNLVLVILGNEMRIYMIEKMIGGKNCLERKK